MRFFCLVLIAVPVLAQVEPARIGCFIDPQQQLREVHGTAGNFIVSGPLRRGVLAALCTDRLTIVKTDNNIEANGNVYAAPPGPASIDPGGLVCYSDGSCVRFGAAPAQPPAPETVSAEGRFLVAGERRIELPAKIVRIEYLGPGWLRILLVNATHMAFSRRRARVFWLPDRAMLSAGASGGEARNAELEAVRRARSLRRQVQPRGASR